MASRTLLLLRRRHALVASIVHRNVYPRQRLPTRTFASSSLAKKPAAAVIATTSERIQHDESSSLAALAAAVVVSSVAYAASNHNQKCLNAAATAWDPTIARQPQTATKQPRNVMLHRMRSVRGRNLEDKYKVDWSTVLGEGAYGSVHPARLAVTGEKVSIVLSSSECVFLILW